MILKKVVDLCKKEKRFFLFDKVDANGEIVQWLGDGNAAYPLYGVPILDETSLCAVFDLPGKKMADRIIKREEMPNAVNTDDTDETERALEDEDFAIVHTGQEVKALRTSRGIVFAQKKYLAPLDDMGDHVRLYERLSKDGVIYIAAKVGMMISAVIFPYLIKDDDFWDWIGEVARARGQMMHWAARRGTGMEETMGEDD